MIILNLKIVGVLLLLLAVSQPYFVRRFRWREELTAVSLLTRQVFFVHCIFISMVVAMMGILALVFTPLLLEPSPLARLVIAGIVLFWGTRVYMQCFVYDPRLWRGNRLNTVMHVVFALLYTYFTATFGWALWLQRG